MERLAGLPTAFGRLAATLACGAAGGLLWHWLGLPLPFIVGAMAGGIVAGMLPIEAAVPGWLRSVMAVTIGIMVGSSFTPEFLAGASDWGLTLAAIALYTFAAVMVGYAILRYLGGYDPIMAYCMAAPGGFIEMALLGASLGADPRRIVLVHSVRLLVVVFAVPLVMPEGGANAASILAVPNQPGPVDWLVFIGCGLGAVVASKLRLPGAILAGPLLLSATAHLTGLTEAQFPAILLIIAQIVVGSSIGCTFVSLHPRTLLRLTLFGGALVIALLALSALFAAGTSWLIDRPLSTTFLLFAPGGMPEMSLIALTLGIEPAMIATHHLFRLILVVTVGPTLLKAILHFAGRAGARPTPQED